MRAIHNRIMRPTRDDDATLDGGFPGSGTTCRHSVACMGRLIARSATKQKTSPPDLAVAYIECHQTSFVVHRVSDIIKQRA